MLSLGPGCSDTVRNRSSEWSAREVIVPQSNPCRFNSVMQAPFGSCRGWLMCFCMAPRTVRPVLQCHPVFQQVAYQLEELHLTGTVALSSSRDASRWCRLHHRGSGGRRAPETGDLPRWRLRIYRKDILPEEGQQVDRSWHDGGLAAQETL